MVAIVGGAELGLSTASGRVLGDKGQTGSAADGRSQEGVTVNAVTGNLVLQRLDEVLVGKGLSTGIERTYNSQGLFYDSVNGDDNGDNWRLGFSRRVYMYSGNPGETTAIVNRIGEDGAVVNYYWSASDNAYVTTKGDGAYDKLTYSAGIWTWTDGSTQTKETYDTSIGGRLTSVIDPNGDTLSLTYNAKNLVSQITNNNSGSTEKITIEYDTGIGKNIVDILTSYTDISTGTPTNKSLKRVSYGYDSYSRLVKVSVDQTNNGVFDGSQLYQTTYTYDDSDGQSHRISSVSQSDGSRLEFTYVQVNSDYRIRTVTDVRSNEVNPYSYAKFATAPTIATGSKTFTTQANLPYAVGSVVRLSANNGATYLDGTVTSYSGTQMVVNVTAVAGTGSFTTWDLSTSNATTSAAMAAQTGAVTLVVPSTLDYAVGDRVRFSANGGATYMEGIIASYSGTSMTVNVDTAVGTGNYQKWQITGGYTYDTTSFAYDAYSQTFVTDPAGRVTVWTHDANGQITSIRQLSAGGADAVLQFNYDPSGNGNVSSVVDSLGNVVTYGYDTHGNRTLERDAVGNTITRVYDNVTNQLLSETTYAVPDPDGAGALLPSGAQTTYYAYDNKLNLRFKVSPEGRVTEYRYTNGLRTQEIVYADALDPLSAQPTESSLSQWVTATTPTPRNKALTQLTTMSYDFRGQLSSVTTYSKVDASGNGVTNDSNFPSSTTYYVYDQSGHLLTKTDARGTAGGGYFTTVYTYDGLGRVLSTQDANSQTTLYSYDDVDRSTAVTLSNGLTTTTTYDQSGLATAVVQSDASQSSLSSTTYTYDKLGHVVKESTNGAITYHIYDAAGRKVADVDPTGAVVEYTYNDNKISNTGLVTVETVNYSYSTGSTATLDITPPATTGSGPLTAVISTFAGGVLQGTYNVADTDFTGTPRTAHVGNIDVTSADTLVLAVYQNGVLISEAVHTDIAALRDAATVSSSSTATSGAVTEAPMFQQGDKVVKTTQYAKQLLIAGHTGFDQLSSLPSSMSLGNGGLTVQNQVAATDSYQSVNGTQFQAMGAVFHAEVNTGDASSTRYLLIGADNGASDSTLRRHAIYIGGNSVYANYYDGTLHNDMLGLGWLKNNTTYEIDLVTAADGSSTLYIYEKGTARSSGLSDHRQLGGWTQARTVIETHTGPSQSVGSLLISELTETPALAVNDPAELTLNDVRPAADPLHDRTTYQLWDAAGRKVGDIDATGHLTEYVYNDKPLVSVGTTTQETVTSGPGSTTTLTVTLPDLSALGTGSIRAVVTSYKTGFVVGTPVTQTYAGNSTSIVLPPIPSWLIDTLVVEIYKMTAAGEVLVADATHADIATLRAAALSNGGTALQTVADAAVFKSSDRSFRAVRYNNVIAPAALAAATANPGTLSIAALRPAQDTVNDRATTQIFNADGLLASEESAEGYWTKYRYDAAGRLVETVRFVGEGMSNAGATATQHTYYIYNADGQLTGMVDPLNYLTEYQYDVVGNKTAEIRYATALTNYSYDATKRVDEIRPTFNGEDRITVNTYNNLNRLEISYQYFGAWRATTDGSIDGTTTVNYGRDVFGNPFMILQGTGAADTLFNRISSADGTTLVDRWTQKQYDTQGRLIAEMSPQNSKILLTPLVAQPGETAQQLSDRQAARDAGLWTYYTYDEAGHLASKTDPVDAQGRANTTLYYYDADGRLTMTVDPAGNVSETVYDAFGEAIISRQYATALGGMVVPGLDRRLIVPNNPALVSIDTFTYDQRGELIEKITGLGSKNSETPPVSSLGSLPDGMTLGVGGLQVQNQTTYGEMYPEVHGTQFQPMGTVFHAEVNTGATNTSRYLLVGADNGATDATMRRHAIYFGGNSVYANYVDSTGLHNQVLGLGWLKDNTTYEVDLVTAADGSSTVYVYEKGTDRSSGFSDQRQLGGWTQARTVVETHMGPTQGAGTMLVSALTETPPQASTTKLISSMADLLGVVPSSAMSLTADGLQVQNVAAGPESYPNVVGAQFQPMGTTFHVEVSSGAANSGRYLLIGADNGASDSTLRRHAIFISGNTVYAHIFDGNKTNKVIGASWLKDNTTYEIDIVTDASGGSTVYIYEKGKDRASGLSDHEQFSGWTQARTYFETHTATTQTAGTMLISALTMTSPATNQGQDDYTYNSFGEVQQHTALKQGTSTVSESFQYDRRGLMTKDTRDSGGSGIFTTTQYDAFGRAIKVTDARGQVWAKGYDRLGRVVSITDPGTPTQSISYDAFDRVLSKTDANAQPTTYAYNSTNRTMTVTTAELVVTTTTEDAFGHVISVQDGRNNITSYTYDLDGRLQSTTTPVGTGSATHTIVNNYDNAGHLLESVDSNTGVKTAYTYDPSGRVLTRTVDAGTGATNLNLTTRTIFNLNGEAIYAPDAAAEGLWTQDATGVWTHTQYDLRGQVIAITVDPALIPDGYGGLLGNPNGLNLRTLYTYDNLGNTLTVTEGAGSSNPKVTQYDYDALGRRIAEHVDPTTAGHNGLNITTSYTYDANGNVVSKTDPNGNVTRYVYDAKNEQIYVIDPTGAVVKTEYDAVGRVIKTTAFADRISLAGFPTPSTTTSGELTAAQVTALQTTAYLNNTDNQVGYTVYDNDGRVRYQVDGAKSVTERKYDSAGNVVAVIRYGKAIVLPASFTVSSLQSAVNTANSATPGLNQSEYTVYDKANQAIFHVDAEGYAVQTVYDANGRVIKQIQYFNRVTNGSVFNGTNATTAPTIYTSGTLPSGPYIVASATDDRIVRTYYDAGGRTRFMVDGEGYVTERQVDAAGHETARIQYAAKYSSITDSDTYALMVGRFVGGMSIGDAAERNSYDNAGRLDTTWEASSTGVLTAVHHEYDDVGRETDTVSNYTLPVAQQSVNHKVYDAAGRLVDEYFGYGLAEQTHTQYVLDQAGNRVRIVDPRGNSGYFYYDADNRAWLQIDPEGYATQTIYTAFGTTQEIVHYGNSVRGGTLSTTQAPSIVTTAPGSGTYILADLPTATTKYDQHTVIVHDQRNLQTQITDAEGYVEKTEYDALGNKASYTNKLGGKYTYTYDLKGNVKTETAPTTKDVLNNDVVGAQKTYSYDARDNITQLVENSASGVANDKRTTTYKYDRENRQVDKKTDAFSDYNLGGTLVGFAPEEARSYDARGNLIEVKVTKDASTTLRTLYYYDEQNRKIAQIDPTGALTQWLYDGHTKPASELHYSVLVALPPQAGGSVPQVAVDPLLRRTDFTYDANNRLLTSALKNVTTGEEISDDSGYQTRLQDVTTTNVYDGNGNVVKTLDGRGDPIRGVPGNATYSYYDRLNQLIMRVDAMNYVTTWTRDANGNVLTERRYANAISTPTSTTTLPVVPASSPDDRITNYTYDRMGRVLSQTVANVKYGSGSSQLIVEAMTGTGTTGVAPEFYGNTTYPAAGDTFSTSVTTGNIKDSRSLTVGLDNGVSGTGNRRFAVVFREDRLYVQFPDASSSPSGQLKEQLLGNVGSIRANTAYVVQIAVSSGNPFSATLTVYDRNTPANSWTYSLSNASGWTNNTVRVYGATYVGPNQGLPAARDGLGPLSLVNGSTSLMSEDFSTSMNTDKTGLGSGTLLFVNNTMGALGTGRAELLGDARTTYTYNGLGQVLTQTQTTDTGTNEVTDTAYDSIGRKLSVKSPGFKDYLSVDVRPETDYYYNALGLVTSEVEVHAAGETGTADHVTSYSYRNGVLISQTDPTGAVINYSYDAAGNITRKTLVGRGNSENASTTDDVTLYQYDAAGREVWHQDVGTGEVRGTRYDAFGDVTGKRLSGTYNGSTWSGGIWQETADFNVQGKAWRTNSGNDAYKVYVFDGNGNATLTIESAGADLSTQTLNQILGLEPGPDAKAPIAANTNLTISRYDARNQLTDTYQPQMIANGVKWTIQQQITQPPGSAYQGGGYDVKNYFFGAPSTDQSTSVASQFSQQVSFSMYAYDADNRGGGHDYLYKTQDREVTFYNLPDYRKQGFTYLLIQFTLDPLNTYHGSLSGVSQQMIPVLNGVPSITVKIPETGYDDERKTPDNDADNRTASFRIFGVTAQGFQFDIGGASNIALNNPHYFMQDHTERKYVYYAPTTYTVGQNELTFNVPNVRSNIGDSTSDQLILMTRHAGTNDAWTVNKVDHWTNFVGRPEAGLYATNWSVVGSAGTYEFYYMVQDVSGNVLDAQTGTMELGAGKPILTYAQGHGLPGKAFMSAYGLVISQQGSSAKTLTIKYRVKGTTNWTNGLAPVNAATTMGSGGYFLLLNTFGSLAANSNYEYLIDVRDGGNNLVNKVLGSFSTSGSGAISPNSVGLLADQSITFKPEPVSSLPDGITTMVLKYAVDGTNWQTNLVQVAASALKRDPNDPAVWHWDPTDILLANPSNVLFRYQYVLKDSSGTVLTQAQGTLDLSANAYGYLGLNRAPILTHTNFGQVPVSLTFKPAQTDAVMKLSIRAPGESTFTQQTTTLTHDADGYHWDASALQPPAGSTKVLDYFYDLYDATGTVQLKDGAGNPLHVEGTITLGGTVATATTKLVITGGTSDVTSIHRSQSYNAFGEIATETDGNVNAGDQPAAMAGRTNTTNLYYNTLGRLVQKDDPYTVNIGIVGADGTVGNVVDLSATTTPVSAAIARPRTYYAYDLAGRLVATQDADGNRNSMTLLAGFGNGQGQQALTVNEYHADKPVGTDKVAGAAKTMGYDVFGNLRVITERPTDAATDNRVTLEGYDNDNRLIAVIHAARKSGTASYVAATVDQYAYDKAGQRISHTSTSTLDNATYTTITSNNPTLVTTGTNTSAGTSTALTEKTVYDSLGRVLKTYDLQGLLTSYTYTYDPTIKGAGGVQVGGYVKTTTLPVETNLPANTTYVGPIGPMTDKVDYFGNLYQHTDFGGNTFTYTYNLAGWLTDQTSTGISNAAQTSGAQSIHYDYYANGYQKLISDNVTGSESYFEYDNEGNRTKEEYRIKPAPGNTYQTTQGIESSAIKYDQLHRVIEINQGTLYLIRYQYDANGNRLHMYAKYENTDIGTPQSQDYWYKYDSMNRFTVTMGQLVSGNVQATAAQGVKIAYDYVGQRISATYFNSPSTGGSDPVGHKETYTYTTDGYLEDTWINDDPNGIGIGKLRARRTNDGLGRTTAYEEWDASGTKKLTRRNTYNSDSQLLEQDEWDGEKTNAALRTTTNKYANAGSMVQSIYVDNAKNATGTTTDYKYEWWDEAKQSMVTIHGANKNVKGYWAPGYAKFTYDVNGHVTEMDDPASDGSTGPNRTFKARSIYYVTDAEGMILQRKELDGGDPDASGNGSVAVVASSSYKHHSFYYFNGHMVGDVGDDERRNISYAEALSQAKVENNDKEYRKTTTPIFSADFDENYQAVSASYPSTTPGDYTVRTGDTLQSIAASQWGDSSMWYMIADANGLTGYETLVAGQTLIIPNKLTNIHNNSSTFKVYDAGETMGNTNPTLPDPPPPPPPKHKHGCGILAKILIVVIAVVVTVYTAGAAGSAIATAIGAEAGSAAAVAATAAGMAIGAAAGSVVSQGLNMAAGFQDSFSWNQVGMAALSAAVTAGIGGGATGDILQDMATAAEDSIVTQGIAVATGMQEKFSWAQVAAAAAGAGVSEGVDMGLDSMGLNGGTLSDYTRQTLAQTAGGAAQSLAMHQRPNWADIAVNSFGSVVGNDIGHRLLKSDQDAAKARLAAQRQAARPSTGATSANGASTDDTPAGTSAGGMKADGSVDAMGSTPEQAAAAKTAGVRSGEVAAAGQQEGATPSQPVSDQERGSVEAVTVVARKDADVTTPEEHSNFFLDAWHGVERGAGALFGVGKGAVKLVAGAVELPFKVGFDGTQALLYELTGNEDYRQGFDELGETTAGLVNIVAHPVKAVESFADNVVDSFDRASQEASQGNNFTAGMIVGETTFDLGMLAEGGVSLARAGLRGAEGLASRSERLGAAEEGSIGDSPVAGSQAARETQDAAVGKTELHFTDLDEFNRAANNAAPNTRYSFGGYTYTTDSVGRLESIEGDATLSGHGRYVTPGEPNTTMIGHEGGFEDVGFHAIGDQFGGPTNRLNVFPGSGRTITAGDGTVLKNLNQSRYRTDFENPVADIIRETGEPVPVRFKAIYEDGNLSNRPNFFQTSYKNPDGSWTHLDFENRAGG